MRETAINLYLVSLLSGFVLCVGMALFSSLFRVIGRGLSSIQWLARLFQGKGVRGFGRLGWNERLGLHLPIFLGLWATFFGAIGILGVRLLDLSLLGSLCLSLPFSLFSTGLLGWWLWVWFLADEEAGVLRGSVLLGTVAQVSLTIPSGGVGRISFIAGGAFTSMPARASEGESIPSQSQVMIVDLEGALAIVEIH